MCESMRKDSANTDEIPIFATSRPSLQCMKCKTSNVVFLLKWKRGDYIQAIVSIAFFLSEAVLTVALSTKNAHKNDLQLLSAHVVRYCTASQEWQ